MTSFRTRDTLLVESMSGSRSVVARTNWAVKIDAGEWQFGTGWSMMTQDGRDIERQWLASVDDEQRSIVVDDASFMMIDAG